MKRIHTDKAPAAIGPYSQAIVSGSLIFTSGQIPINPASGNVEAQDIEGQTEQVCKNLEAVLTSGGSSPDRVIKTTCFLNDMSDFALFNSVYEKHFPTCPARSCVAVRALPRGVLVEIEAIAEVE